MIPMSDGFEKSEVMCSQSRSEVFHCYCQCLTLRCLGFRVLCRFAHFCSCPAVPAVIAELRLAKSARPRCQRYNEALRE